MSENTMRKKMTRGLVIYGAGFLLFFVFRLIYGCTSFPPGESAITNQVSGESASAIRNYASSKMKYAKEGQANQVITVDQKYERIADLAAATSNFTDDENKCRKTIADNKALIQHESRAGLKGKRTLNLTIGVDPERFDAMTAEIEKTGTIISKNISKIDKTNEYKDLNAKKDSLLKTRQALIGLKGRGGKIEEFIQLENRILAIEEEIQQLGVRLGEYDAENEFCTIKFSLRENAAATGIPVLHRVKVALEWSISYYLLFTVLAVMGSGLVLIIIILMEKLGFIKKLLERLE